jgi:arylsulfatase
MERMNPLRMTSARLVPALLLGLIGSCSSDSESPVASGSQPHRVLLISLDTLRADHTGFGGYSKETTPFLDSLAERGVVFDNHFSNSNCTLPSHATMLTGLHFPSHGVRPVKNPATESIHPLPESAITLAERFKEAGYATTGFTAHGDWLTRKFGFAQGFDHFVGRYCDAELTIKDYLDLIDDQPVESSFTFLHFFDIHSDSSQSGPCMPYRSNGKLIDEFAGAVPEGFTGCSLREGRESNCASKYLQDLSLKIEPLPEDHRQYLIGLYDAGIRLLDNKLRILFEQLEERGQLENTLVVITADHGESFYEHETMLHDTHHDEVAQVPLIILLPEKEGVAPRRVSALTQSTDLAATILELSNLDPIGQVPSLARKIMLNEEIEDGLVMFQGHVIIGRDEQGEYKFIKTGNRKPPIFFDRSADPEEQHNLLEGKDFKVDHRDRMVTVYKRLNDLFKECTDIKKVLDLGSVATETLSAEEMESLRGLGYLGETNTGSSEAPERDSQEPTD